MSKAPRPIRIEGDLAYVPLTRGYEAIIDACDAPLVEGRNWFAAKRGAKIYACRSAWRDGSTDAVLMHRVILGAENGTLVDHRDGDGLNNRKANLRSADRSQNAMNSAAHCDGASGVKGVHWSKAHCRWKAEICARGVRRHLGLFDSIEEAAQAYGLAAKEMHGDFARVE